MPLPRSGFGLAQAAKRVPRAKPAQPAVPPKPVCPHGCSCAGTMVGTWDLRELSGDTERSSSRQPMAHGSAPKAGAAEPPQVGAEHRGTTPDRNWRRYSGAACPSQG